MARRYGSSRIPVGMVPVVDNAVGRRSDLAGKRFGSLVAVEKIGKVRTNAVWRLRCDCGGEAVSNTGDLRKGSVKSCGCLLGRRSADPTPAERADMVALYVKGSSLRDISARFRVSTDYAVGLVREHGARVRATSERKLPLDEAVFSSISPESAHWAGFLFADGHVCTSRPALKVTLSGKDEAHLYKLREFLKSGHSVQSWIKRDGRPACAMTIQNKRLADGLASLGMNEPSSTRLPVCELIWSRDFWRGAVDGDGSILLSKRGGGRSDQPVLQLVGYREFVDLFRNFVRFYFPESTTIPRRNEKIWTYAVKARVARGMMRVLYEGATTYLDRKYEKAMQILSEEAGT